MLIGTPPNQVDITKVSTERLLAYKRKYYNRRTSCCQYHWRGCEECEEWDKSTHTDCQQHFANYDAIKAELATREHIEDKK